MKQRTSAVELREASKTFGGRPVVRAMNLSINAGEKVALIGPSGSGKTTILRLIASLEQPDQGELFIFGEPLWRKTSRWGRASVRRNAAASANVGMVFQQFNLFPHMTVLQNVMEAPVRTGKHDKSTARSEALRYLSLVGMADRQDAYPSQLSGGQQQRVAIARALAMEPKIILFDEVTSALDPELVAEVLKVIDGLANDRDLTMLLVTHQMHFAKRVSTRVLMFDQGIIVEDGPPSQIFGAPQNERTARFLEAIAEG